MNFKDNAQQSSFGDLAVGNNEARGGAPSVVAKLHGGFARGNPRHKCVFLGDKVGPAMKVRFACQILRDERQRTRTRWPTSAAPDPRGARGGERRNAFVVMLGSQRVCNADGL